MESRVFTEKDVNRTNIENEYYYTSQQFLNENTYTKNDLGLTYSKEFSTFKVWSPTAKNVYLHLYEVDRVNPYQAWNNPNRSIKMENSGSGVWEVIVKENLNGLYYMYSLELPKPDTNLYKAFLRNSNDDIKKTTGSMNSINNNNKQGINL